MNNENSRKALGNRLRALREQKELSMYKIARTGGITQGQVKAVEDGNTNYTINILLGYLHGCGLCIHFSEQSFEDATPEAVRGENKNEYERD